MYDRRRRSEEDTSTSVQDVDRKGDADYIKVESSSSENAPIAEQSGNGVPPGHYRQGYCSCCQVHYINLEKHLASDNHRQLSMCNRIRLGTSVLMERFLQDVHQYHPQNYHDTRPTYDDIPEANMLSSTNGDQLCNLPPQSHTNEPPPPSMVLSRCLDMNNVSAGSSEGNYRKMPFPQSPNMNLVQGHNSKSDGTHQSVLTSCQKSEGRAANVVTCSSPFKTLPLISSSHQFEKNDNFIPPHFVLSVESSQNLETKYKGKKRHPGPNVTTCATTGLRNTQFHLQGSCYNVTSGTVSGIKNALQSQEVIDNILRDCLEDRKRTDATGVHNGFKTLKDAENNLLKSNKTTVDDTIDEVIWKYCHESSSMMLQEKDKESVFSLNIQSITGYTNASSLSFDWKMPLQFEDDHSKMMHLDCLESNVNLDEDYESKLKCVLRTRPLEEINIKPEPEEQILPALPHVPPSFVGKTWSQVMYEDDLKVEALVKQFRKGKFHCYFEDGSLINGGKKHHKMKITESKCEAKIEDQKESETIDILPLLDHHSDIVSVKSEKLLQPKLPKPCRRTWRQASRCQVVKVSHGTQTSLINFPVVKKKILKNEQQAVFDFVEEKTPDMKTRMCALKLPDSYTKILTPLQPKTMVYVLSHPDIKASTSKAASICSRGRNQYSTDSRDSVFYKYKQSTPKYYDPLTNRILKTPPRISMRGMGIKAPCVRKLFRTLSSDVNVENPEFEQKASTNSKKSLSSCSTGSLHLEPSTGKDLNPNNMGSALSVSTEYIGTVKTLHPEKPYANFSLSPLNSSFSKTKEDIQQSSMIPKSITKALKPKKIIRRDSSKPSTRITRARMESRNVTKSKDNPQRMVKKLAQGKATRNKQPSRKPPSEVAKSTRGLVQTFQSRKKVRGQRSQQFDGKEKAPAKSQFVSEKPAKTKPNISKEVSIKNTQSNYQDKIVKRTRSRVSEGPVYSTIRQLRSRLKASTTDSTARTNRMTRKKVR